jgi:hypothetical protein
MSMPNTQGAMPIRDAQAPSRQRQGRDLRLDFFRGLALMMIFIDHVAGNQVAAVTLRSLGFADAAEVFVLIAGIAGVYAYRSTFLNKGLAAGAALVLARIRTLYLAHLLMIGGALLFAMAALLSGTEFDVIGKLGLAPLMEDPLHAFLRLPLLAYMPHYLDILPLYIVLFAMLPAIILGMRWHPLAPAAVMLGLYALAHGAGLTLPNLGQPGGWFLNPFAWALLFALGAASAEFTLRGAWGRLPRSLVAAITAAAAAYVVFAFLHAAPWKAAPGLDSYAALGLTLEADKSLLSWHRLLDILAKAWLVAVLVPRQAAFMSNAIGEAISRAGRHSLPVFAAGVMLSLAGSVVLHESGGAIEWHVMVSVAGVGLLLALAALLDLRQGVPLRKAAPSGRLTTEGVSAS